MPGQQRTNPRTWEDELIHRKKVIKKLEKIQGLQALLDSWQATPLNTDDYRAYLRTLKQKLRTAQTQYACMKP
jgi:hypothetical protein